MKEVRIEWDAEHDTYHIIVHGYSRPLVLTIKQLNDLSDEIAKTLKEVSS